uniref:Uncharacterized protein n=1 Tax=Strigamia maritima TaxID=126957 RepID=T1JLN2_STRMM
YKVEIPGKSLPILTNLDKGKYSVVVFENLDKYINMDKWNRELLDKYCREYKVGIIGFIPSKEESLVGAQVKGFPLFIHTNLSLKDCRLNPLSPILRLTRAGEIATGQLPAGDWTVFHSEHETYSPLATASALTTESLEDSSKIPPQLTTVIEDRGMLDGIHRVIFGNGFKFWLHRLLFLDALSYLSNGKLSISLHRYILIDIDDIFVGERGTRMKEDDVTALLDAQKQLGQLISGFRFNLGFSGKFYHSGYSDEDRGDDLLLGKSMTFIMGEKLYTK